MRYCGLFLLAAAVLGLIWPVQVRAGEYDFDALEGMVLDMEQAVKIGLERNPRMDAMDYGVKRSASEVRSARGGFFPRASAGYSRTRVDSIRARGPTDADYLDQTQDTWTLRVVQALYAGGTIRNAYQRAQLEEEISRLEKESEEQELIRKIQEHFLLLLKAREDRRALEDTVERLEVGLEAADAFYAVRLAPYVDVLQAEVELAEARQNLSQVKNEEMIQRTRLNALLDLDPEHDVLYRGELKEISPVLIRLELALQTAQEQRTDLKFIERNMEIAAREKDMALGRKLPRVNLELSAVDRSRDYREKGTDMMGAPLDRDQANRYWTAGISIEWNFFSGGQEYYRRQSMDYEIRRLGRILEDASTSIQTEVRTAHMRLEEARERMDSARMALSSARENYEMQKHRFKQRVGTIMELLTAQEHLTRADARLNQALLDYQLALAELYFAMGEKNYGLN